MSEREPWPLEPSIHDARAGIADVLKTFVKGVIGGTITLGGLGMIIIPNLVEARGATRSWVLEKAKRKRCLELGLTLEQLEALERAAPPEPPR